LSEVLSKKKRRGEGLILSLFLDCTLKNVLLLNKLRVGVMAVLGVSVFLKHEDVDYILVLRPDHKGGIIDQKLPFMILMNATPNQVINYLIKEENVPVPEEIQKLAAYLEKNISIVPNDEGGKDEEQGIAV
jgi:hypothetical protein